MRMRFPAARSLSACVCALAIYGCSVTQSRELPAPKPQADPIQYLGAWGNPGGEPAQLGSPRAIATDARGNVYIADAGDPTPYVHKFTHDGHPLLTFEPIFKLTNPCAMAVDSGGSIYVMECRNGALARFVPDGSKLRTMRAAIRLPQKAAATGVAVDEDGRIYVGQAHPTRIVRLAASGRFLASIGGAKVSEALGEVDQIAAGANEVFVADSQKHRVTKLASSGAVLSSWTWQTETGAAADWCALAANSKFVFLLSGSPSAPALFVWTPDGTIKFSGLLPVDAGIQLTAAPSSLAATESGELLVLNSGVHQVLRYRINLSGNPN